MWQATMTGLAARAHAAQKNSFETFPLFAVAVVVAMVRPIDAVTINAWAATFLVARLAFSACYLANWAGLRSVVWFVGQSCSVGLLVLAAMG